MRLESSITNSPEFGILKNMRLESSRICVWNPQEYAFGILNNFTQEVLFVFFFLINFFSTIKHNIKKGKN